MLDGIPDRGGAPCFPIVFTRQLLERVSGEEMSMPDARSAEDVALLEKLVGSSPSLASTRGWGARFGRELNASDDKALFWSGPTGWPVLEGKHVHPFQVRVPPSVSRLRPGAEFCASLQRAAFERPRLGYRDVACPTNRLTLIAAMLPAESVTVHTVFCLKTSLPDDEQWFLCGVLNSFVANFLVRLRVTTHVTTAIVSRLPVPRPAPGSSALAGIAELAHELAGCPRPEESREYVDLQGRVARLYQLTEGEMAHLLGTFPLVPAATRSAVLRGFAATEPRRRG
ncbi:MAG: hypothetical protein EHM13_03455 [Acidobacteria bacterium]|nr:MAG: hypothetical protein EHM13_03455 [Acidobacteriota bacterium]